MEIREKSRPRACATVIVLVLPHDITFPRSFSETRERKRERRNRCPPHARTLVGSSRRGQVQYPWMSVDLVTHTIVKRGLNSNPSRAAGRVIDDGSTG
ncbi:hypothetical protein CAJAP_01363 [Camponotus japonicus]